MNTQIHELKRLLAAVDSSMSSAEAQMLIRDSRKDIEHGRRSIAKAIKIVDVLDSQQVQGVLQSAPTAFGELPPFSGKEQTCDPLLSAAHEQWLPMATAPTDGTLVRLLVQFKEHSIDDGEGPFPTIGFNNVENDRLDEWQFAGWCWGHDHFTTGAGTPVGWLPLHGELVPGDEPTAPEALATKLIDTWCATHGGQIPWEKAVEITAIATSMSSEERERLLAMADASEDQGLDNQASDPACEAIRYALEECEDDHDAIQFLKYWNEGEFDILRRNWPNLTDELFIGADPLFKPTTGVES